MKPNKVSVTNLKMEAERLVASGQMPSLESILEVITEVRLKYSKQITEARREE